MRPIHSIRNQAVFDRIVVDISDVRIQIGIVLHDPFPETPLPYAPLPALAADGGTPFGTRQPARERGFYRRPAPGIVCIAPGQLPDAVQMVGQNHNGNNSEWARPAGDTKGFAKDVDVFDQKAFASLEQIDREEERATRCFDASIVRHSRIMPATQYARNRK